MKLLLAATALTLGALLVHPHLPSRKLDLTPPPAGADYFLMPSDPRPDHSRFEWRDKAKLHWACHFGPEARHMPCNFTYLLGDANNGRGIDLSRYKRLELDLRYTGTAQHVRMAVRNFDPRFSKQGDGNSAKFNNVHLAVEELNRPLQLQLTEFTVAEWWAVAYRLPRQFVHTDMSNATALLFDLSGDVPGSHHELRIVSLAFVGEWIDAEQWYLGIILLWLFGAAAYAVLRLAGLRRTARQQRHKIDALMANNLELRFEKNRFRKMSTADALTRTLNRRGIEATIEALHASGETVTLILLDLDHFKAINDSRGHDAGDRVLRTLSEVLLQNTRSAGKVGRWGGEEFVLICPSTPLPNAAALAERLRWLIETTVFEPANPLAVTASFGVVALRPDETFDETFKRADEALYIAKSRGRNCVVVPGDSDAETAAPDALALH